jgi:hypothetical protein
MEVLARKTGFRVKELVYDSNEFQFVASEMYANGLPLHGPEGPNGSQLTESQIAEFRRRAEDLNRRGDGDQFVCVLAKETSPS